MLDFRFTENTECMSVSMSVPEFMRESIVLCMYDVVVKKFTFAISSSDEILFVANIKLYFSALHGMPARTVATKKLSVCPSVCPSVCQTRGL